MKRTLLSAGAALALLFGASAAYAQHTSTIPAGPSEAPPGITFPIGELGNCSSKDACKTYCADTAHQDACFAFAQTHGLMNKEEVSRAKQFAALTGPGGCRGEACKAYCEDFAHREECRAFAKDHNLDVGERGALPGEPSAEIEKSIANGGGPGGCSDRESCKAYCDDSSHQAVCLTFGRDHGLISKEEYDRAQKFIGKPGPGGCKGEACKTYCEDVSHQSACMQFAKDNGLISAEDAKRADALTQGGPGGCKGEACKAYCEDASHRQACFDFAVKQGIISQDEASRSQQFLDKVGTEPGPGGCTGGDCKTYCDESAHQSECQQFANVHNLMQGPPHQPPSDSQHTPGSGGPGGCSTSEECMQYCTAHPEACKNRPAEGAPKDESGAFNMRAPQSDSGRNRPESTREQAPCSSPAECQALCEKNPDACAARDSRTMTAPQKDHEGDSLPRPYRPELNVPESRTQQPFPGTDRRKIFPNEMPTQGPSSGSFVPSEMPTRGPSNGSFVPPQGPSSGSFIPPPQGMENGGVPPSSASPSPTTQPPAIGAAVLQGFLRLFSH